MHLRFEQQLLKASFFPEYMTMGGFWRKWIPASNFWFWVGGIWWNIILNLKTVATRQSNPEWYNTEVLPMFNLLDNDWELLKGFSCIHPTALWQKNKLFPNLPWYSNCNCRQIRKKMVWAYIQFSLNKVKWRNYCCWYSHFLFDKILDHIGFWEKAPINHLC